MSPTLCQPSSPRWLGSEVALGGAGEGTALSSKCSGPYHPDTLYPRNTSPCGSFLCMCLDHQAFSGPRRQDWEQWVCFFSTKSESAQEWGCFQCPPHPFLQCASFLLWCSLLLPRLQSKPLIPQTWLPQTNTSHFTDTCMRPTGYGAQSLPTSAYQLVDKGPRRRHWRANTISQIYLRAFPDQALRPALQKWG